MTEKSKSPSANLTDVKIFISSTFSDLDKERNYISQVVFNSLRDMYKGISINEIDLRWGITEEQANKGKVIDLCLQYIRESNPFFIGILGDRYGTSFPSKDVVLSPLVEEYFPHAADDISHNLSATEIEILNGVVRNPDARAIFFIKKNAHPYPGETKAQWASLERLKKRVRESGHKVVDYSDLEDFDIIKDFVEEHIGSPEIYSIPVDGMERADRISRLHYERSLSYIAEVPYDSRLDRLLEMIDETVSKSKKICAFVGAAGVGKSTTLAYMAHNFTGERIYVPLYGDIDELPSTTEEIYTLLKNALRNALFRHRRRQSKWYQFKEWFRDGLKEINYNNTDDFCKEILRHKWCFVLDNYEASEWLAYRGFGRVSFSKLRQVYDKIISIFITISDRYRKPYDIRQMLVRDIQEELFFNRVNWNDTEPVFDMAKLWWFKASEYIPAFMKEHGKNLYPQQIEALITAPMRKYVGHVRLTCRYMVEFVKFDEVGRFVESVHKATDANFLYRLYLDKITEQFDSAVAVRAFILLEIYKSGISMKEFEKQMELGHVDTLFLLRLLSPFTVDNGKGIRLKDYTLEYPINRILGISDCMFVKEASRIADVYHKKLFEENDFLKFEATAKKDFHKVAEYFDFMLPINIKREQHVTINALGVRFRMGKISKSDLPGLVDKFMRLLRDKYWLQDGNLTYDAIAKAYRNVLDTSSGSWTYSVEDMRNYLMASYAARKSEYLFETVHNPYFIRKMWDYPLYLFVWDSYLKQNGEFAAPYSRQFPRELYDIKAIIRIENMLKGTFYERVWKQYMKRNEYAGKIDFEAIYLKHYPK